MYKTEKFVRFTACLDKWLTNRERGRLLSDYFHAMQIKSLGIYGYGILGKHLVRELREEKYSISWIMDKSAFCDEIAGELLRPSQNILASDVDIAIITLVEHVEEVEAYLKGFISGKIITIEELIDFVYAWGNQD